MPLLGTQTIKKDKNLSQIGFTCCHVVISKT
jgi:hypothetical protein